MRVCTLTSTDEQRSEELVERAQPQARMSPLQHNELLSKHEVFQDEIPTATKEVAERSEPKQKQVEHGPELYQIRVGDVAVSH